MRQHGNFEADGRNNWERMLAGDWYIGDHPKMAEVSQRAQRLLKLYEQALQKTLILRTIFFSRSSAAWGSESQFVRLFALTTDLISISARASG